LKDENMHLEVSAGFQMKAPHSIVTHFCVYMREHYWLRKILDQTSKICYKNIDHWIASISYLLSPNTGQAAVGEQEIHGPHGNIHMAGKWF
jgi:hypothetical protein